MDLRNTYTNVYSNPLTEPIRFFGLAGLISLALLGGLKWYVGAKASAKQEKEAAAAQWMAAPLVAANCGDLNQNNNWSKSGSWLSGGPSRFSIYDSGGSGSVSTTVSGPIQTSGGRLSLQLQVVAGNFNNTNKGNTATLRFTVNGTTVVTWQNPNSKGPVSISYSGGATGSPVSMGYGPNFSVDPPYNTISVNIPSGLLNNNSNTFAFVANLQDDDFGVDVGRIVIPKACSFDFNCNPQPVVVGNFVKNGGIQPGYVIVPITDVQSGSGTLATVSVSGNGFSGSTSVNLNAGTKEIVVPITYNGINGTIGSNTINVQSTVADNTCSAIATISNDGPEGGGPDGVGDVSDLDDDNDGILDVVECPVPESDSVSPGLQWLNTGGSLAGTNLEGGLIASVGGQTFGSGLTQTASGDSREFSTIAAASFGASLLEQEYVEYSFTTGNTQSLLSNLSYSRNTQTGSYRFGVLISSDDFATQNTLIANSVSISSVPDTVNLATQLGNFVLLANTTYKLRVHFWSASSGNVIDFDNFSIGLTTCDSDGDGNVDQLDLDSDGDGITDNVEAQGTNGYRAPGALTDVDENGIPNIYNPDGINPIDSDGDRIPDYLDLDSDNQNTPDTEEAGLTLSGVDADGDGLDDNADSDKNTGAWGPVGSNIATGGVLTTYPNSGNAQCDWRLGELCLDTDGLLASLWLNTNPNSQVDSAFWQDRSGFGRHAEQSNTARQPAYSNQLMNFREVLNFDGSDEMVITGGDALNPAVNGDFTIFTVYRTSSATNNQTILAGGETGTLALGKDADNQRLQVQPNTNVYVGTEVINTGEPIIGVSRHRADTIENFVNGMQDADVITPVSFATPSEVYIGSANNGKYFNGDIAEVFVLPFYVNDSILAQVESFAALKYGITLQTDYYGPAFAAIWDTTINTGYNNDIFGIGRAFCFGFDQRQSYSNNLSGMVAIGGGNRIDSLHRLNPNELPDGSFLIVGDDQGGLDWVTPDAPQDRIRIGREWKVQETGQTGSTKIIVPALSNSLPQKLPAPFGTMYLFVDNDGDFTTGAVEVEMTLNANDFWEVNYNLQDGQYFSFGTVSPPIPGCSLDAPNLWLEANNGTSTNDDSVALEFWNSNTINQLPSVQLTEAERPLFRNDSSSLINFNPVIEFDGSNDNLDIADNLGLISDSAFTVFSVFRQTATSGTRTLLGGAPNGTWRYDLSPTNQAIRNSTTAVLTGTEVLTDTMTFLTAAKHLGDDFRLFVNGQSDGTTSSTTTFGVATSMQVGASNSARFYQGDLAELIVIPAAISTNNQEKIQTYLAIKYGITLNHNYIRSDGVAAYDLSENAGYLHNIAGIGREDCQGLYQRQSASQNEDGYLTIGLDNIAVSNAENTGNLRDQEFLVWSSNGQPTFFAGDGGPRGYPGLMYLKWKVAELDSMGTHTDVISNLSLQFDLDAMNLPAPLDQYVLVIDTDNDGSFSDENLEFGTLAGSLMTFSGLNLNHGNVFTFVAQDNDLDGTSDYADIDDDNDGILDHVESPDCFNTYGPTGDFYFLEGDRRSNTSISTPLSLQNGPIDLLLDNTYGFQVRFTTGQDITDTTILEWELPVPVMISEWVISTTSATSTFFADGSQVILQAFDTTGSWTDLSPALTINSMGGSAGTIGSATGQLVFANTLDLRNFNRYRLYGVSGMVNNSVYLQEVHAQVINWIPSRYPKLVCANDVDGDGNFNHLDPDSDGDGCPDAFEGGATNDMNTFILDGPYSANGLANSVETNADSDTINYSLTYDPLAISDFLNLCADTDNDGIVDLVDIDDDNDGVRDSEESPSCFFSLQELNDSISRGDRRGSVAIATDLGLANLNLLLDGGNGSVGEFAPQTLSNSTLFDFGLPQSVPLQSIRLYLAATNTPFGMDSDIRIQGSQDSAIWTDLSLDSTYSTTSPTAWVDFLVTQNQAAYRYYRLLGVSGQVSNSGNRNLQEFELVLDSTLIRPEDYPKEQCTEDSDGDGIYNHLDTDSDNDGCFDSYESGATLVETQETIPGGVGSNGLPDAVETNADSDTTNYTSSYTPLALLDFVSLCEDSDGDGIGDINDIDDDNDGIPDVTESPDCFPDYGPTGDFYYFEGERSADITMSADLDFLAGSVDLLVDGLYGFAVRYTNAQDISGQVLASAKLRIPVQVDTIWLTVSNASNTFFNAGSQVKVQGLLGGVWTDVSEVMDYDNTSSGATTIPGATGEIVFPVTKNANFYEGYRLMGVTGTVNSSYYLQDIHFNVINWLPALLPIDSCMTDSDGDGLANHLDLDSDGDGCYDSFEAGVTGATNDGSVTDSLAATTAGEVGSNGLADAVETMADRDTVNYRSTYYPYAISDVLITCDDTDTDGVGDLVDIDDDNDGIRDSEESPACFFSLSELNFLTSGDRSDTIGISTDLSFTGTAASDLVDGTASGITYTNAQDISNKVLFAFNLPVGLPLDSFVIQNNNTFSFFNAGATVQVQGSLDSVFWVDLSEDSTYDATATGSIEIFPITKNKDAYTYYRVYGISGTVRNQILQELLLGFDATTYLPEFYPKASCTADQDVDGLLNHLDLDRDGDGCYDSYEAGVTGATFDGSLTDSLTTGSVGANGLADNVETSVDSDTINYLSTYSPFAIADALNLCADTDTDGVGDLVDIDDDNDGIRDSQESPTCFMTLNELGANPDIDRRDSISVSSDLMPTNSTTLAMLVDGVSSTANATRFSFLNIENQTIFSFRLPAPAELSSFAVYTNSTNSFFSANSRVVIQGSTDSMTWTDLSTIVQYDATADAAVQGEFSPTGGLERFTITQNAARYRYYRVFGLSNTTLSNQYLIELALEVANYRPEDYPKLVCDEDFDNDGISNHLDLDSDGDGCYDSFEAGVSGATNDGSVTDSLAASGADLVGLNGLADAVETNVDSDTVNYNSTYYPIAASSFQNACIDSDGDGIGDLVDIDDDNDGIRDNNESPICFQTFEELGLQETDRRVGLLFLGTDLTVNSGALDSLVDGDPSTLNANGGVLFTNGQSIVGEVVLAFRLPVSMDLDSFSLFTASNSFFSTADDARLIVEGSVDSVLWTPLSDTLLYDRTPQTNPESSTNYQENFPITKNNGRYFYYRIRGVQGSVRNQWMAELKLSPRNFRPEDFPTEDCTADLDGDGMLNHLDLDMDGDGCFDKIEGGVPGFTFDPLNPMLSDSLTTGGVGANGWDDNLETTADSDSIGYDLEFFYRDSTLNACDDTDMDGIGDLIDIDDDNDGIPDMLEDCDPSSIITTLIEEEDELVSTGLELSGDRVSLGGPYSPTILTFNASTGVSAYTGSVLIGPFEAGQGDQPLTIEVVLRKVYSSAWPGTPMARIEILDGGLNLITEQTWTSTQQSGNGTANDETISFNEKLNGTYYLRISDNGSVRINGWGDDWSVASIAIDGLACDRDTDGDGIPNSLDLDSDGDGCYDVVEAQVPGATQSTGSFSDSLAIQPTGNVGSNGLADKLETSVDSDTINFQTPYNPNAISTFLNTCTDTDMDGISDLVDIDDDNDGIRDSEESPECFTFFEQWQLNETQDRRDTMGVSTDLNVQNGPPSNLVNGNATNNTTHAIRFANNQDITNQTVLAFSLPADLELDTITIYTAVGSFFQNGSAIRVEGSRDSVNWTPLSNIISYDNSADVNNNSPTGYQEVFPITMNQGRYFFYRIRGLGGLTDLEYLSEIVLGLGKYLPEDYPRDTCNADIDRDGLLNHLDLDADGDGCYDTFEGGVTGRTLNQGLFSDSLAVDAGGAVGANGLADAAETSADSDSINYELLFLYRDSTQSSCQDTDMDGIVDTEDIDDDNDGIPDVNEDCEPGAIVKQTINTKDGFITTGIELSGTVQLGGAYTSGGFTFNYAGNAGSDGVALIGPFESPGGTPINVDIVLRRDWNTAYVGTPSVLLQVLDGAQNPLDSRTFTIPTTNGNLDANDRTESFAVTVSGAYYLRIADNGSTRTNTWGDDWSVKEIRVDGLICNRDTDGDGIRNSLDLDSDGDGCYDVLEATVPGATNTGGTVFTDSLAVLPNGQVGSNGLSDALETAADSDTINYVPTYDPFAASAFLAGCIDTDGDGIGDLVDIDDDNDGIRDSEEAPSCYFEEEDFRLAPDIDRTDTIFISTDLSPNAGTPNNLVDGLSTTSTANSVRFNGQDITDNTIFAFSLPNVFELDTFSVYTNGAASFFNAGAQVIIQASADSVNWTDLSATLTFDVTSESSTAPSGGQENFVITQNAGRYRYYRLQGVSGTLNNQYLIELELGIDYLPEDYPMINCAVDTDGDGIINQLDLDSDGDGCYDTYEAGVTGATFDGSLTDSLAATTNAEVGPNGLADAVETAAESNMVNYPVQPYYQDPNQNFCDDTDTDGIPDVVDIDDDNDGIPDVDESLDCGYLFPPDTIENSIEQTGENPFYVCSGSFDGPGVNFFGSISEPYSGSVYNGFHPGERGGLDLPEPIRVGDRATLGVATKVVQITGWGNVRTDLPTLVDLYGSNQRCAQTEYIGSTTLRPNQAAGWIYDELELSPQTADYESIIAVARSPGGPGGGLMWSPGAVGYILLDGLQVFASASGSGNLNCEADLDTDGDGIPDRLDLDSDGDGCPDVLEAGHGLASYPDSVLSFPVGDNGLADAAETSPDSDTINYAITQTEVDTSDFQNGNIQGEDCFPDCMDIIQTMVDTACSDGSYGPIALNIDTAGTWSILSSIGSTINPATGTVSVGTNIGPQVTDTLIFEVTGDPLCMDTFLLKVQALPLISDVSRVCNVDASERIEIIATVPDGMLEYSIDGGATYQMSNVFERVVNPGVPTVRVVGTECTSQRVAATGGACLPLVLAPEEVDTVVRVDSMITFCPDIDGRIETDSLTICDAGNGLVTIEKQGLCLKITGDVVGVDTICVVACDSVFSTVCDTTQLIVAVTPPKDTLFETVGKDELTTICPTVIPEIMANAGPLMLCGAGNGNASEAINGMCMEVTGNTVGRDTICMVVCDQDNPLFCDTTIAIIDIIPVKDTVEVSIPPGSMQEVCITDELDLPGNIISEVLCASPVASMVTVDLGTSPDSCLTLTVPNIFAGMDTLCVIHCDDSNPQVCDTTIITVIFPPPTDTTEVFLGETCLGSDVLQLTTIDTSFVCDPDGQGTDVTVDVGADVKDNCITLTPNDPNFVGSDTVCVVHCQDFDGMLICDTSYLAVSVPPAVDTISKVVTVDSIMELCITSDAAITPGGDLQFCDMGAGNAIGVINGQCVDITGVVAGVDTFCVFTCDLNDPNLCDTTIITITINPPKDTVPAIVVPIDSTDKLCVPDMIGGGLPNPGDPAICDNGNGNATEMVMDSCIAISGMNPGTDTICIVVCDSLNPDRCDTIVQPVIVTPPVDTIFKFVTLDSTMAQCVNIDPALTNPGNLTICDPGNGNVSLTPNAQCVDITGNLVGMDTICVVVCDQDIPELCDTSIIIIEVSDLPIIAARVLLQGALLGSATPGIMHDSLRSGGYLPLTDPYGLNETTTQAILDGFAGTNDAAVDWVILELRDGTDSTVVLSQRAGLVQRDGDIVDPADGSSPLTFQLSAGVPYYVAVNHRNHLGVMTASALMLNAGTTTVDFISLTDAEVYHSSAEYEGNERAEESGFKALWAGDVNEDGKVKYEGGDADLFNMESELLGATGNDSDQYNFDGAFGYFSGDINLSGQLKLQGFSSDILDKVFLDQQVRFYPLNPSGNLNYDAFLEQIPK